MHARRRLYARGVREGRMSYDRFLESLEADRSSLNCNVQARIPQKLLQRPSRQR
jgi:hypothetical protein